LLVIFSLFALYLSQSICDKYSRRNNLTNLQFVDFLDTQVFIRMNEAGAPTLPFFNGQIPKGSVNLSDPANADELKAFTVSLAKFNGAALGCSDGTIAKYMGPTMKAAHSEMMITARAFDFHNTQVLAVLSSKGATVEDQQKVLSTLETLRDAIVTAPDSICDKYSKALKVTNKGLVTTVVTATFNLLVAANAPTLKYFNGVKPPGSTDFTRNKEALGALVDGLVAFFGVALGCTDGTIGPYRGGSLAVVHKDMMITLPDFHFFNRQVIGVLKGSGVTMADAIAVERVLNGTKSDIVTARR